MKAKGDKRRQVPVVFVLFRVLFGKYRERSGSWQHRRESGRHPSVLLAGRESVPGGGFRQRVPMERSVDEGGARPGPPRWGCARSGPRVWGVEEDPAMSAVGRPSPSRGRLLGPVTGARCVFPPKPRPPHLERGAGGGAWPRSRLVGPAGTAGLSGIAAAPRARVLVRGTGAARPVPGAPDTPARLSSSCCPQTPRGGGRQPAGTALLSAACRGQTWSVPCTCQGRRGFSPTWPQTQMGR